MPVIIDASVQGKLQHPIIPNVLTEDDKMEFNREANGMINVADQNVAKINRARGIPAIPAQVQGPSEATSQGQAVARANSVSITESVKGQTVNATA